MRNLFFILLSLIICGCSYNWQSDDPISPVTYEATSYRSANSVGKLRRLVLMPLEMKSYEGKYASEKDQEAGVLRFEDACASLLTEKKGYDIIIVREADGKWQSDLFEDPRYDTIQDLYQKWHNESAAKHSEEVIQEIGRALDVDGLLVVRINERKTTEEWNVGELLLDIALMNLPLFYNIVSPNVGAWIYETDTGRLVWRKNYSSESMVPGSEGTTPEYYINGLFADLENAVPRQLIK